MNWSHIGQRPPLKAALEPQRQGIFGGTVGEPVDVYDMYGQNTKERFQKENTKIPP